MLRAEQHQEERASAAKGGKRNSREKKRVLAERRKLSAGLPRPLACAVRTRGAGDLDREGTLGWRRGFRGAPWSELIFTGILALPTLMAWAPRDPEERALPAALLMTALALYPVVKILIAAGRRARTEVPASLLARTSGVRIEWEGGGAMELPTERITRVETSFEDLAREVGSRRPPAGKPARVTVVVTRDDGAGVHVRTSWKVAKRLEAAIEVAIEVARADGAARRAAGQKARKDPRAGEVEEHLPPAPAPPAPRPLNEAALAALDRNGRSVEAWREGLRAAFAGTGYRRAPLLPPEELAALVTDTRVSAERRIGAALALSLRADEPLSDRLRIASAAQETPALRVAVERAAAGTLEDEVLTEALAAAEAEAGAGSGAETSTVPGAAHRP